MNYGLDSYAAFEEPFPFEDTTKTALSIPDGCLSLRSLSPENPVLGDSGWDVNDGEKVDLFPSPTKKATQGPAPLLPAVPIVNPVTIPAIPAPILVPAVITAANVVIPLGTARFTGFTASSQVSHSFLILHPSSFIPYPLMLVTFILCLHNFLFSFLIYCSLNLRLQLTPLHALNQEFSEINFFMCFLLLTPL